MKIFDAAQTRRADQYTIAHEPVTSIDLMERAATRCYDWMIQHYGRHKKYKIFCGTGNNGGDGLVIGRLMAQRNIEVEIYVVKFSENFSEDCLENLNRLKKIKKIALHEICAASDFPDFYESEIVVDALFGSGLNKPVNDGWVAELIHHINQSQCKKIAIDIPSGLFMTDNSENTGAIIEADYTLTFQFPKLAFLFASNHRFVGHWQLIPIGLHKDFLHEEESLFHYIDQEDCHQLLKKRNTFSHKGTFGHALVIGGSYGKMGAAVLASRACIRAGAGLVTAHVPMCGYSILQTSNPEIMCSVDEDELCFSTKFKGLPYQSIGVGPGLGLSENTQQALKILIQNAEIPLVFDADALNILSENKTWLSFLPSHSILTPHPKEFERLTGMPNKDGYSMLMAQMEFSKRYRVFVVLKGAHTSISTPFGTCYFNSSGNPGMATAGSGDVLTGILTGLMAQGYSSLESCVLGVYLHGLAGDLAAKQLGFEALTAGDILNFLGKAFKKLYVARPQ